MHTIAACTSCAAQVAQKGITLEYNRSDRKTTYTKPVEFSFEGASSTNNQILHDKGSFVLMFRNSNPGERVSNYQIQIGDQKYVLFNKNNIGEWNLSSTEVLEIVLCRKDLIDYLEKTYTQNQVNQLNLRYEKAKKEIEKQKNELKKAGEEINELNRQLDQLNKEYQEELNYIKARAVLFAYVDEERLDSLELLRRECILNNDFEGATAIGNKMDFKGTSEALFENLKIGWNTYSKYRTELLNLSMIVEDHIQNCISAGYEEDNLQSYYATLTEIYKNLMVSFEDSKSQENTYLSIKKKYGALLYHLAETTNNDSLYYEAANQDNSDALYHVINYNNFNGSLNGRYYAKKLLDNVAERGYEIPEILSDFDYDDAVDEIRDNYESFPDFVNETDNGYFFYHIIGPNDVSLVDFVKKDKNLRKLRIPETVIFKGQKYILKKIGSVAFGFGAYGSIPGGCDVDSLYRSEYNLNYVIPEDYYPENEDWHGFNEIILPNSIEYIGSEAFEQRFGEGPLFVNFPKNLKVLKKASLATVSYKNNVVKLPEGVEEVGDAWWNSGEEIQFIIPSSVKKMTAFRNMHKFSPYVKNIKLISNDNFIIINDMLYTSDSTEVFIASTYKLDDNKKQILYIPANLKTDLEDDDLAEAFHWLVDSIVVNPNHPLYASIDGVLYDKNLTHMICQPFLINDIRIPATLKQFEWYSNIDCAKSIIVPDDLNPETTAELFYTNNESNIHYLGKTKYSCTMAESYLFLDTLMSVNPNNGRLPYIKGLLALKNEDYHIADSMLINSHWPDSTYKAYFKEKYDSISKNITALLNKYYQKQKELEINEYDKLIVFHNYLLEKTPQDNQLKMQLARLYNNRGIAKTPLYAIDDYEKAISLLEETDGNEKNLSILYGNLASSYFEAEDYLSAYKMLENDKWTDVQRKAKLKENLSDKEKQIKSLWEKFCNSDTLETYEYNDIFEYYENMGLANSEEGKIKLAKILRCRGAVYFNEECYASAIQDYIEALNLINPIENPDLAKQLYSDIDLCISKLINEDHDDPYPYVIRGLIFLKKGDIKDAKSMLDKVKRMDSDYAKDNELYQQLQKMGYETGN